MIEQKPSESILLHGAEMWRSDRKAGLARTELNEGDKMPAREGCAHFRRKAPLGG
jgi:hypothetical protein